MNPKPTDRNDMGIVHSTIRMLIPLSKQSEALEILQTVCAQIQFNPNCIRTHLYRGVDDVRAVMIEERWTSDEHVIQHLRSDIYRRLLLVVEMAEEPPEIFFDIIERSTGIEKIEKAHILSKQL
jgi:quinol monooxygenase YgiN